MAATKKRPVAATRRGQGTVSALVGAALALPGLDVKAADPNVRSEDLQLSYSHGHYSESGDRIEVDIDQFSLKAPVGDRFELSFDFTRDLVSGASPWFYTLNVDGSPNLFLQSGASIKDKREVLAVGVGYYGDKQYVGINLGQSVEDDYESEYVSIDYRRDLGKKNTTLLIGAAYSSDEVWDSRDGSGSDVAGRNVEHRDKSDLLIGISQVLNRDSVARLNLGYSRTSGSLSDPYKQVFILDSGILDDSRPDQRYIFTLAARYSHYFKASDSALHLDYRFAADDWGTDSHTLEGKWNKHLGGGWQFAPGIRYYSQHSADFYDLVFNQMPADGEFSTDYRLAGFGSLSYKLSLSKSFGDAARVGVHYERYKRKHSLALDDSRGHAVDDYRYDMLSISISTAF